ncbi:hypothetical protein CDL12_08373 [Handroanthus impetiginosus]|uniref:Non-structural maintenance of chromosomes element 4 n=1 Tax=Handroanthus impetiginosus TaxID=429701 RepID=A0A2G9HNV4_9LAMI|nr:hypothetical protein CDL12_08373 [Handroanthus impetiginosus]
MEKKPKRDIEKVNGRDSIFTDERNEFSQGNDTLSKRRIIRSHYREIENRIHEGKDEIANADSKKFMAIMNEVENVHQHVTRPREQVADAEAFLGLANTLVTALKTHTRGGITPAEFVSSLIREFELQKPLKGLSAKSPNISWEHMSRLVSPIFKNASGCRTMIGSMNIEHKERRVVVRAKRSRPIGKAQPKELEKAVETVADTDRNIRVMFEILKKEKKVKVENLILNRSSFAQTIENLFALSFLVKDGRVRIDLDDGGSQVVVPSNGPSAKEIKSGAARNHHFIFRIDFEDWELMKTLVAEGDELMPRRDVVTVAAFADPVTVAAYADVVTVAACAKAKAKPHDKAFGQTEGDELMPRRDVVTVAAFADPVTVAAYADVVTVAASAKAKAKPHDKAFGQTGANANNFHVEHKAPVKKFSRNYGHTMQRCDVTEHGDGSVLDLNCKRKRSPL